MDTSRNIASIVGPVFLALGASILINPDMVADIVSQMRGNVLVILLTGIITLVAGLAIVRFHRETSGWPLLVTVLGWLLVVGGLFRIVLPKTVISIGEAIMLTPGAMMASAVVVLGLGGFLTWQAYR